MMETRQHLHELEIVRPCSVPWAEMQGDDQVRMCGHCEKMVYNFSEMNEREIISCLRNSEVGVCAQIRRSSDGKIVTKERTSELRPRQFSLFSLMAITTAVATLFGFASHFKFEIAEKPEIEKPEDEWLEEGGVVAVPDDFFENEIE